MTSLSARIARPAWVVIALAGLALVVCALVAMPGYYRSQTGPAELTDLSSAHLGLPAVIIALVVLCKIIPPVAGVGGISLIITECCKSD